MKKIFVLFVAIFLPIFVLAQKISGKIVDERGEGLLNAKIILKQNIDSSFVAGTVSGVGGTFDLMCNDTLNKYLQISLIGYETKIISMKDLLQPITLQSIVIDEAVVTAHKKIYKHEGEEITAKVKGTLLEQFLNANKVIEQLPFISGTNGDFIVFGKGKPLIYINNHLVRNAEELNNIPSSQIKMIKINMMPGAKYDASVNAVIHILTEKNQGEGLSGTLYVKAKQATFLSSDKYVDLNYRKNTTDFFGSVYYLNHRSKIKMETNQRMSILDTLYSIAFESEEKMKTNYLMGVVGFNSNVNKSNSLGMQYTYTNNLNVTDLESKFGYKRNKVEERAEQFSHIHRPGEKHSINAYYNKEWNENFEFNLVLDWVKGANDDSLSTFKKDSIVTFGNRNYDLYASKAILSYKNSNIVTEVGAEYMHTNVNQSYKINNEQVKIENSEDVMHQNRWGAFLTTRYRLKEVGILAGLRFENINFDYRHNHRLLKELTKSYIQLFPSIQLNYATNAAQFMLGYERKAQYPAYNLLKSNVQYSTFSIYESGNPLLKPQIKNDFTALVSYNNMKAMMGYSISENYIVHLIDIYKNSPIMLSKPYNVKKAQSVFFTTGYDPNIGFWRPRIEFGGQWTFLKIEENTYNKPNYYIRWNNYFSLPKSWLIGLDTKWSSEGHNGIYLVSSIWTLDFFVSKDFFNDKLSVSLDFNDVFNTSKIIRKVDKENMFIRQRKYRDTRSIELSLRYNFNVTQKKYKGNTANSEINRL